MNCKGSPGVKSEIVLADGQRFESLEAFATACGITYPTLWRRMWRKKQPIDDIAREKGLLKTVAAE